MSQRQAREVKEREQENEELWRLHREKLAQMEREKNTVKADLAGLAAATKRIREKVSYKTARTTVVPYAGVR